MPGDSGFFPPVQYSAVWILLGLGLLALVVAWYVIVHLVTRPHPVVTAAEARAALAPAVRERYVRQIDDVAEAHRSGELSGRQAHQRLSALVRGYAHETSGYPASAMTLSELRRLDLPRLTHAVERFYPAEFGAQYGDNDRGSVASAVDEARRVVLEWV